ncbi:DUF2142 domain-containing protein [Actinomadura luteofluorescens]|uniref:DUF2142 domain-containing protein n=1 Tax=Actinomadura luteofluorescens TaxID=46163 RepID=UPI00348F6971
MTSAPPARLRLITVLARQSPPCFAFEPQQPASCAHHESPSPRRPVEQFSASAGRYQPTYYALVGWPLRWRPGETGLLLARLIGAAVSAAFLAAAVHGVLAWSRRPFLLAGLLIAVTPMAMHLAGVVNANGLEITAAIAMRSALGTAAAGLAALGVMTRLATPPAGVISARTTLSGEGVNDDGLRRERGDAREDLGDVPRT